MENLKYQIIENDECKQIVSEDYNYVYNRNLDTFLRWGKTKSDTPVWAPYGPEYIYVEVEDMSMELFTVVINVLNTNRTIAKCILIGTPNAEMESKFKYCLSQGIMPTHQEQITSNPENGFFSLFVTKNGIIHPDADYIMGIDIMDINNFYIELWQSFLFRRYRWEQLQQQVQNEG